MTDGAIVGSPVTVGSVVGVIVDSADVVGASVGVLSWDVPPFVVSGVAVAFSEDSTEQAAKNKILTQMVKNLSELSVFFI